MPSTPRHSVSVAAVVTDDHGRVLVTQRRDNGKWEPLGGVLELEETIEASLRREISAMPDRRSAPTTATESQIRWSQPSAYNHLAGVAAYQPHGWHTTVAYRLAGMSLQVFQTVMG